MEITKKRLSELQTVISKMPFEVCCMSALPELGVRWREVSRAVRNARLPMTSDSVARVICRHAAKTMTDEEIEDIVVRLRLKLIATQARTSHVINLLEPTSDLPVNMLTRTLPNRVLHVLRKAKSGKSMRPEVQSVKLGDLIYMSIQLVSSTKQGSVLYVATPPGEPVALVSSIHSSLLKIIVQGLGYQTFEDASLHGKDIPSLLRIHNQAYTDHADHLVDLPEYRPMPVLTSTGADYTNKSYDEQYVKMVIGPNPPKLTSLTVSSEKPFFDPHRLNKKMKVTIKLRSEDVAQTLTAWAVKGAVAPTSELFHIFHKIKSNKIVYDADQLE